MQAGMIVIPFELGLLVSRLSSPVSRLSSSLVMRCVSCSSRHAGHGKRCVSSWQAGVSSGCFKQAFVSVFMRVLFGRTCFKQTFALVFMRTGGWGSRVRVATQIAIEYPPPKKMSKWRTEKNAQRGLT